MSNETFKNPHDNVLTERFIITCFKTINSKMNVKMLMRT